MDKTNEVKILTNFLKEFNPICATQNLENWSYRQLVEAIKETVKEM